MALSPHRARAQNLARRDLRGYTESGRSRLHTHSKQHVHICSTKRQPGQCQREWDSFSLKWAGASPGSGGGRLQPAMTTRDFWLFGEAVCPENWTVTGTAVGVPQTEVVKGKLKHAGQLPCQQRDKIISTVCSY